MACGARWGLRHLKSTVTEDCRIGTTVALFPKHDPLSAHGKLNKGEGKPRSLEGGQTSVNSSGHVLQTSQGEGVGLAQVEGAGAAMQGAMDVPGLDTSAIAEFARRGEAAVWTLEGEASQRRKPGKPLSRIGSEGKHPLGRGNDDVAAKI